MSTGPCRYRKRARSALAAAYVSYAAQTERASGEALSSEAASFELAVAVARCFGRLFFVVSATTCRAGTKIGRPTSDMCRSLVAAGVKWSHVPQGGTQTSPQHVAAHAYPGGQSFDVWQLRCASQTEDSPQMQQPSVVTQQKQHDVFSTHAGADPQPPHPPLWMHDVDPSALAVDAVTIAPAPTTAAPTPARLSSFLLEMSPELRMTVTSVASTRGCRLGCGSAYAAGGRRPGSESRGVAPPRQGGWQNGPPAQHENEHAQPGGQSDSV